MEAKKHLLEKIDKQYEIFKESINTNLIGLDLLEQYAFRYVEYTDIYQQLTGEINMLDEKVCNDLLKKSDVYLYDIYELYMDHDSNYTVNNAVEEYLNECLYKNKNQENDLDL